MIQNGIWFLLTLPFIIFVGFVVFKFMLDIVHPPQYLSKAYQNRWLFAAEVLFTVVAPAFGFILQKEFDREFPFSKDHLLTLIFLAVLSVNSYWASRLFKGKHAPLVDALIPLGILQGILLNLAFLLHFGTWIVLGLIFPLYGFALVAPLINVVLLTRELYLGHLFFRRNLNLDDFQEKKWLLVFLSKASLGRKSLLYFILLMPFFAIQQALLVLLGQRPDAAVRVFVESCGFNFSDPSFCPPPSGHYLCTIAAHGNPSLVKPLRKGLRWGYPITVNRQLLIANAFEQWLEEFVPKTHHHLRKFYDSLKIPVDKWSRLPWVANLLYLVMKPLEWFFLLWLYLTDTQPENRIAQQYFPKANQ